MASADADASHVSQKPKSVLGSENPTPKYRPVGILSETKNHWERRAPLTPDQVRILVDAGVPVLVEKSNTRTFGNEEYARAGATVVDSLYDHDVSVVLGIKQIPAARVPHDGKQRTYAFFSHTFKKQSYNCGRFAAYADAGMSLLDYELILKPDGSGQRAMKFGPYAGLGGAIDGLHSLGRLLLDRGFSTPFLYVSPAWQYRTIEEAYADIRRAGDEISSKGLPPEICPLVFGFTSEGDASKGAKGVFDHLPCKWVDPNDLRGEVEAGTKAERHRLVLTTFCHEHMVERVDGKPFSKRAYYDATPGAISVEYKSIFAERYAPYVSVLVNCMFWAPKYPRMITFADCATRCKRLLLDVDVTCDPNGTLQFFVKDVPINKPFYTVSLDAFAAEAARLPGGVVPPGYVWRSVHDEYPDPDADGPNAVLVYGVDHIPAETPVDASRFFGAKLLPYVFELSKHDPELPHPFADLPTNVNLAFELAHGRLTSEFSSGASRKDRDLTEYLAQGHSDEWKIKNSVDYH